jgi:transposase
MDLLARNSLRQCDVREDDGNYHIEAESRTDQHICPSCQSDQTVDYGRKKQLFMDSPIRGKRVGIQVSRKRHRCKPCKTTFMESLPDMDDRRLAIKRLVHYIEKQSLKRTFASIADDTGVDEKTIRNIFWDYANYL